MTNINRRRFPILLASALALLAILGALLLPITAQAQTATVLVSNIGQTSDAVAGVDNGELVGQVFTVASGGGNYTLTSIEVPVDLLNTTALTAEDIKLLSASLWSADEFALPVSSLQTLDNPSSISDGDTATFTDPSGTTLEAGKRYAVVFVYNKSAVEFQIKAVGSGSEDGASLAGWNISNVRRIRAATATTWTQDSNSLLIRVNGSAASGEDDPPPLSTDATLSGLSLGTGVTLSPAFASGTDTYTASVANSVDEVTVTPTENHASATVVFLDTDDNELDDEDDVDDDFQVALSVGDTVIKVKVTAEDGTSTQTYTVTVTRAAEMTPDDSGNVSEGDTDLPADTTTTGKVEVGGSVTGTIADTTDDLTTGDSFKVDLEAGKRYQIDVEGAPTGRGTLPDPWLGNILDPDGNLVQDSGDNDDGVGLNARLILTPTADGTHYVKVNSYFVPNTQPGTYTLSVILLGANGASEADTDFPNNNTTSGRVEVGASVTGNTATVSGDDWFRVDLEADKTYQFDLEGAPTNRGTLPDPLLKFYDGSENQISRNDDIDPDNNLNSQIVYAATVTGTYYLSANSTNLETGTYTLSVRDITPPCTLNIGDLWCGVVTVGEYKSGGITFAYGFVDATTDTGALSDTTFDVSPNSYTIDRASVGVSGLAGQLIFSLTSALTEPDRAKLVLHVDGSSGSFAFDGVTPTASFGYRWTMSGLDWSSETSVTLRLRDTPVPSTDATLSGLSLGTGVTLSPAFASGTDTYTASVANSVDEVTVTPTTNHASATVEILDTDDNELDDADDVEDDFQVALSVGDTVIKVKVTAEDGTSTQTYTVTVTRAAEMTPDDSGNVSEGDTDLPGDTTTTGKVEVGGSVTGKIRNLNDKDWFAVELEAGKRYQIDMEGADTGRGTLTHPRVSGIYDAAANAIANTANNGGGVGNNARVIYTPDAAGTYYVEAYFQTGELNRTYTLSVIVLGANGASEADTDFPATTATTGEVDVGGSVTGNRGSIGDTDWFAVVLEAGKTYQIDLTGEYGGGGTLKDPYLDNIRDSSGNRISNTFNNDVDFANDIFDSQIIFTPTAAGTYYLVAIGNGSITGTYTLSVRDITTPSCTLNTGDVWCGVVTVGMFTLDGTSYLGYLDGTGGGGMLSDNDFDFTDTELDSKSHTITGVLLDSGTLSLVFEDSQDEDDKPVLDTWDLQVGTDTFALDDDDVTQLPTGGYQWTGTGLSWSVGDTVTLRLRGETGPPSVANVAVTSMPLLTSSGGSEQDTYGASDEIEFTVTFSQVVVVTGDPQFGFSLSGARQADYRSGSGSTALKFVYTVQSSDSDDDGIWIGNHNSNTKSLQLDANDEITSPGGIDANLEHDQKQVQAGHKVDGSLSSKPTLSIADAAATEGSNVSFTVTLSAADAAVVTATWTASIETGDTAVAADLGATKTGTVTVSMGNTTGTFTVSTVEDSTVEVNETFTVTLSGVSSNAQLSSTAATAQGTINNDDLATLSTDATLSGLSLGTGVTLSPAFASGTVTYTASVANSVDKVTVTPTTNHASATVEILDKDDNEINDADDVEDDFQVALSVGDTVIKVKVTAEDGTSTQTYTATVTRDDFPADTTTTGQVDVGGSVTGNIDSVVDIDWFRVDLKKDKRYQIDLEGADTNRGTLTDPLLSRMRNALGNVVTDALDSGIGNNARRIFTAPADGTHYVVASSNGVTGTYTLSVIVLGANGVSEADTDFTNNALTSGRVDVGASATGNVESATDVDRFRVDLEAGKQYQFDLEGAPTDRGTLEDPYLSLIDPMGTVLESDNDDGDGVNSQIVYTATATGAHYLRADKSDTETGTYTLSVRDITLPTLSVADASDAENDGEVEFTVTLSEAAATAVTATWTASIETGDTAVAADLGSTKTGTVTVAIGDTMGTFEVPVVNDATDEGDETFTVTLSGVSSNAKLETDPTAKGTIEDDDATLPTLSIADAAAAEGSPVSFTVTLSAAADAADVTATWTASIETSDTAVAADLGSTKTGTVTVSMGSTTGTFTVATVDDTTVEVNETFTVTLSSPSSNAQLSSTAATAQGTINNDDLATVSVGDAEGDEDEGVEFTLTLSAAAPADVTVDWTASIESGDTASTADLATTKTGTVTITKGDTTKKFTVPVNDDSTDEPDQTFTVTLSNPTPTSLAQLAADPTAKGTIDDDDDPPTLTVADARHVEGHSESRTIVTVSLSEVSEKRVRFKLRPVDRTGDTASGTDWSALYSSPPFNAIDAGIMSRSRFAGVVIQNDTLDEDDETLTVEAYSLENATGSAADREATITIVDDDPTPTVTVADAAATEGDKVEFVVTLSAVSGRDVDVDYATSVATGDGATSGTDFTAASGTLTIAAADSTATGTIEVQTTEDDTSESAETFTLTISSPDNATLTTDTTATGTINNRATTAAEPTTFAAAVGDEEVVLSWDAPVSASGVTRHEYQYKEGTGAYKGWVQIANSGVDGANEAGFTVTGLTNEVLHTFQLRAVNAQGESTAAEADPVTPTPGICGRTQQVQDALLERTGVEDCKAVTVADLAGVTSLDISIQALGVSDITALKSGDFGGLTGLTRLNVVDQQGLTTLPSDIFAGLSKLTMLGLISNQLNSLPSNVFSDLTKLTALNLRQNELTSLPSNVFSDLTKLENLDLGENELTSPLPAGLFDGLTALEKLFLGHNELSSLPAGLFDDPTALETLRLNNNDLSSLPPNVFAGLAALEILTLSGNDLTSLPAGLFSGLTGLTTLTLGDNPNSGDTLALTVTVEKFGTDQARAKVLAGAPFAVDFTATVANGSLPTGVTKLAVEAGSVEGTAVTVTRTSGTMAAVTVDLDLSTQPTLATDHTGYEFEKAASGLPVEILPDTRGPQNFTAKPGDGQAVLSWTAPASGSGVTKHQYRQKEGTGSYPANWTDIPNSAEGGANEDGYTVTGLTNETVYTFELKRFVGTTESATAESNAVTPTPGICDRTQQVQDVILDGLADVSECAAVTVADLESFMVSLDLAGESIASLKSGDFAGLSNLLTLELSRNTFTTLPANVFSGLTSLTSLKVSNGDLSSIDARAFSGLTALEVLKLDTNDLVSLPGTVFSGLTTLITLELNDNDLDSLPGTVFSGLSALHTLHLQSNDLTALPAGLFSGLSALSTLTLADNDLTALPAQVFSGLTSLKILNLSDNDLNSLDAGVFSGLSNLRNLSLRNNQLSALPDGLLSGLTALTALNLSDNTTNPMLLTVTVEKFGTDQARAKVLAGAPFAVDFTATVVNGSLPTGVTKLAVAKGSAEGTAVTVTRTTGTMEAVTVDIDLSTQPSLPDKHEGYTFARASDLPAEILPAEASLEPPTGLSATPGDRQAVLAWTPPASDSGYTQHQYRYRTDGDWTDIPDSGPGEANATQYTVTGLDNAVEYSFELRARDAGAGRSDAATVRVTPTGPPRILSVEVTSGPGLDGDTYGAGEEVDISVTFDQPVEVSGAPQLALNVGGSRLAVYHEGNGSKTLVFVYVVTESDRDTDGVSVGEDALRLNGGRIGNGAGDDAELDHEGLGQQSGHMVDGGRRAGVHDHGEFTHSHSHSRQQYPEHTHEGHEHPDDANGHKTRPGTHVHHAQEDLNAEISGGPDVRTHDWVVHIHRCFDLKPSCNQGDDYAERGDELGLPIEVTHSHEHSEPGHRFDWRAFFEEGGSGATVSVADAVAVRGEGRTLDFEVSLEPAVAFAVRVAYATADGTATAGEDYLGTSGVLEIPPGQTRATVSVRMPADGPGDGPELFELRLSSATAATVADGAAMGTILMPGPSTQPVIKRIAVVSTPRLSWDGNKKDTYGEGENIRIAVTFDQPVLVVGDPTFALEVGDPCESVCEADYESGSGADTLVFAYLVLEVDVDRNGIAIRGNPIEVVLGDSIRNAAGQEARLTSKGKGTQRNHKVDGSQSAAAHLLVANAEAHEADGEMTFTVRLEPHGLGIVTVDYATRDGSARAGEDYTATGGTLRFNSLETERTVTVPITDDTEPDDGETFTLTLSNPDGAKIRAGDGEATGTIRNSEPQEALTASFEDVPAAHDGAAFRFRVAFSEDIGISFQALREDAFAVTNGRITDGVPVDDRRDLFDMTLEPDGDGDVAVTLEADRDCAESGAICTKGEPQRRLTTTVSAMVAGPDGAANAPATGAPAIIGTVQVGETLTADTSGIADANGLTNVSYNYQWLADDADIAGATGYRYTLADSDEGRTIRVRVTFTDDAGNEESLTSAPTEPVLEEPVFGDGPPGAPRNLTVTAGDQEVTLSWEPPADNGNAPATRYRIEWRIDGKDYKKGHWGPSGETTYTKTDLANGVKYIFRVKAENGNGNSYGPYGPASEEVSATPTSGLAVDLGTPVLSNTKTLHHGMVQLDWEDVEDAGWYVVQYYHVKGGEWLDLPAAGVDVAFHGSSAVVSNVHGLSWLRVRAMSCAGESEWSQIEELYGTNASDWEGVPVPEVAEGDEIEPCPVVLGTPVLSNTETLHHGMVRLDWEDIEDAGWYVVQYYHAKGGEWLDLPAEGVDIAFHGSSAVASNLHGLSWLRVRAMSCAGASEWSQIEELYGTNASDWEGVPVPEVAEGDEIEPCSEDADTSDNTPATGVPTISGTAQVGETLTANTSGVVDADGLKNATFSYQWLADNAAIAGATGSTYTLADSDEGKAITVQVSFTDDAGNNEALTSAATAAVAAAPTPNSPATGAPTISGTAQVGETLTADRSGIADADGLTNATFSYQWLADDADINGATGSTYTVAAADEGKAIKVRVTFTDDAGNEETLTSAATAAVAGAQPTEPPARPTGLSATASHDSVTLTWEDPGDDTITGYVILRRVRVNNTGGDFSELVLDTGSAATTYTDDTVVAGITYTYRIKAINGAGTSERSRWFHIDTPAAPVPDKPTGLSATASHDSVTLTWEDPGDDSITGYVILRRLRYDDPSGHFDELVADTGTAATTYTDDTVKANTHYTYRIKAISGAGVSERSRWFHIQTQEAP